MDDAHTSSDATPDDPTPASAAPPTHRSPADQVGDVAKRLLRMITGRPKS
jgi:hypothetical protein